MKVDTMETSRFRIGEFCKRVGITPQTAREWERRGYIKPLRSCGGHRLYTEHDVVDALNSQKNEFVLGWCEDSRYFMGLVNYMSGIDYKNMIINVGDVGFVETLHHIEKGDVIEVIFAKQSESEQYMAIQASCRKHNVACFVAVDENGDTLDA